MGCDDENCLDYVKDQISPPYMIKPRFGGGGKNIRKTRDLAELKNILESLKSSRQDFQYFIEPAIEGTDNIHLEYQYMGDGRGRVDLIGARDCSPQVGRQKWLERSINLGKRPDIAQLGLNIGRRLGNYLSWGTVECLVKPDGTVHLLEVNPRLQVEHGVTELDVGYDFIGRALELSCYHKLEKFEGSLKGSDDTLEFRLYARTTGKITHLELGQAKCWCTYREGMEISGAYDGMVARIIIKDANGALESMKSWGSGLIVEGIGHNIGDLMDFGGFREIPMLR